MTSQQLLQHPKISEKLTGRQDAKGDEIAWCIFHDDGNGKPPHEPNLRISSKGYYCFACKAKGSLRDLAQHLGIKPSGETRVPAATWSYYHADGSRPLYQKCRLETPQGKSYRLRRPAPDDWQDCPQRGECQQQRRDCHDGWIWSLKERPCSQAVSPVLYNLPMLTSLPDAPIQVAEGEKCCDALIALDLLSVCNPYGAGEWRPDYSDALQDREVVILPDADKPGRDHGQKVASALRGTVASIKILDLYPGRKEGSDVADWIAERRAAGHDGGAIRAELEGLIAQTPEWRPEGESCSPTSPPTKGDTVGSEVAMPERLQGVTLAALRRSAREAGTDVDALPLLGEVEPPIFQRGLSHIVAAPPKAGKTTLLYAEAKEWAQAGISTLFISEEPEVVWYRRLGPEEEEDQVLDRIILLPALGERPDALLDRMGQGPEEIVILDTAKILGVEDENDAANVNRMITPWVVRARETGKSLIVAHHMRKGGGRAVEALAGSYSWAALFDTVVEIQLDEQDSRRQLRAVGRLLSSCKLLYELRDGGELIRLGSPEEVELGATKERALDALTGEWMTTAEVHGDLGDPKPSPEQLRLALNSLASEGRIERDPPWSEGQKRGATYRWRIAEAATSLPTTTPLVGGEVGGSDQGPPAEDPGDGRAVR